MVGIRFYDGRQVARENSVNLILCVDIILGDIHTQTVSDHLLGAAGNMRKFFQFSQVRHKQAIGLVNSGTLQSGL
jgi:hypothetical protein